jgi:hypothetical protein
LYIPSSHTTIYSLISNTLASTYFFDAFFTVVSEALTTLSKEQGCLTYRSQTINNILLPTTILPITHPKEKVWVEIISTITQNSG